MGHRRNDKYVILWAVGGLIYISLEAIWRGHSHWTMFILAGIVLDDWLRYWWWGEERPCYKIL